MTTGRINQVTIVRRGWPPAASESPPEKFSHWRAPKPAKLPRKRAASVRLAVASSARPWAPRQAYLLSPSPFPRAPSAAETATGAAVRLGAPQEGGHRTLRLPLRHQQRGRFPLSSFSRIHKPEAMHPQNPPAAAGVASSAHPAAPPS